MNSKYVDYNPQKYVQTFQMLILLNRIMRYCRQDIVKTLTIPLEPASVLAVGHLPLGVYPGTFLPHQAPEVSSYCSVHTHSGVQELRSSNTTCIAVQLSSKLNAVSKLVHEKL